MLGAQCAELLEKGVSMSVKIKLKPGIRTVNGDDAPEIELDLDNQAPTAYIVLETGVLLVLINQANTSDGWEIDAEYSRDAWLSASGTRYVGPTKDLYGSKGRIKWQSTEIDFPQLPDPGSDAL